MRPLEIIIYGILAGLLGFMMGVAYSPHIILAK